MRLAAGLLFLAGAARAAGVGTSGADFLTVGVGARQLAMGSAFSAVDSGLDANAVNWNPGALPYVRGRDVTASYNSLFVDEHQGFVGYAAPIGKDGAGGAWAAGLDYLTVAKIQKRAGDTESADSTFSDQNFALSGSYGRAVGEAFSVGASLKYVRESFDAFSGNAMALDAGTLYRSPVAGLTFGLAMRNLGSRIGPDSLPLAFQGGAAYKLLGDKLTLASDYDWLANEKTSYLSLGAELWLNRILGVRAGYQLGHGADQLQSSLVGLGVGLGLRADGFSLDYAFLPYGDLGNTHRITLGYRL